ncbi:MAG: PD-(D/E)XK motif protein [Planctomycetia bacterium]
MSASVEELFRSVEASGNAHAYLRISSDPGVDVSVGIEDGRRAIYVICPAKPVAPEPLQALGVEVRQRSDSRFAMIVKCIHADLNRLFTGFAESVATAVAAGRAKPEAAVRNQIEEWRRLLAPGRTDALSDRELMGLVAELLFLEQQAAPAYGFEGAVTAWLGPLGGLHDFDFTGREVEVKSHTPSDPEIWISSIEQLSATPHPLFLWIQPTCLEPASSPSGEPIAELVSRARKAAGCRPETRIGLEHRLVAAGWGDRDAESQRRYTTQPPSCFAIGGEFPRLDRKLLPPAVTKARYALQVSGLLPFRTPSWRSAGGA